MVRPAATGLATAFFRLYLLDALAVGPARPAALLAAIAAERLPFASGAFGRALQSLLEGGYVTPAQSANVALTPLGAVGVDPDECAGHDRRSSARARVEQPAVGEERIEPALGGHARQRIQATSVRSRTHKGGCYS